MQTPSSTPQVQRRVLVPWCPPNVQAGLCGVMVPPGELTQWAWMDALEDRINRMVDQHPQGLRMANRALSAMGVMGVVRAYEAGGSLFSHNLHLQTVLSLQMNSRINPFPAKVPARPTARMEAVREALEETDLEAWLEMALAETSSSSLD